MDAVENTDSFKFRWRWLAALLIVGSAAFRVLYLALYCPLDLAPDEAHYWDWSRHLDWSYYSKGPVVAYLIRLGEWLCGSVAKNWTGNEMLAVRLPAVLCGALLLTSLYVLAVQVYRREKLAFAVVAIALTLPVLNVGAALMTIDAPYTCCWGWALVLAYQAVFRESRWAWPVLGLVIGIGILAKYTMVLFVPSLGLFLLFSTSLRNELWRPSFWIMAATGALCCVPLLLWNAEHGWVSVRHVGGQAGVTEAQGLRWIGPLEFIGTQAALYLGFWFVVWARGMVVNWPTSKRDLGTRYLWWMSAPMFLVFLFFSIKTPEEPNWPVTAYISGLVLAIAWLADYLQAARPLIRGMSYASLALTCAAGIALSILVYDSRTVQPLLARVSGKPTHEEPLPLRRFDPSCRLRGWHVLAAAVDQLCAAERASGHEPIIVGTHWTIPGELGFYCSGHPPVYSVGLALGDRHSQYDLWHPNPITDADRFRGSTFIVVGDLYPSALAGFERTAQVPPVTYWENGYPLASWNITIGRGFRGFPNMARLQGATY